MTVSIEGTTPGIAVDGTGAVVNVTVTTGAGGGGGVELGETSTTAYRGDRGKTAYDHSQVVSGNPHGTTAADVGADPAGTAAGLVDDLSGVSDQATARTNLGLGTAATAATGDFAAASHTHTGTQVTVDASGFNGNLTTSDDTVQEVAQKLDDLVIPAAGIADPGGSNDDFLQRKSGAWTYRTVAQVKTDLGVAPIAAGPPAYPVSSGSYIANLSSTGDAAVGELGGSGRLMLTRMWIGGGNWDRMATWVASTGSGTVWRFGWYPVLATGATGWANPFTIGTLDMTSTGGRVIDFGSTAVTEGWYDFAILVDTYVGNPVVQRASYGQVGGLPVVRGLPGLSAVNSGSLSYYYTGVTTGSLPTSAPSTLVQALNAPIVKLRKA